MSSTIFSGDSWISSVYTAGLNTQSSGLMGAIQSSGKYKAGSIKAYLANNALSANALSTIMGTGTTDKTTLAMQMGDAAKEKRLTERLAMAEKFRTPAPPPVTLDSYIYFDDGSTLDTVNNIITMVNGKKIDAVTGADYVDPASRVDLANGSYIDTANNVMYMTNGTKIDTITGLVISVQT